VASVSKVRLEKSFMFRPSENYRAAQISGVALPRYRDMHFGLQH